MPAPSATRVQLWLVRHGETAWAKQNRHTGRTDIPLTDTGRQQAVALRPLLATQAWDQVLCSPLARARETAELALPGVSPVLDDDLVERDYGPVEGRSSIELRETDPAWDSWRTPIAGAETIDEVGARADRVIARVTAATDAQADRRVLIVAHGHLLRVLAARWVEHPADLGSRLTLDVASASVLGYEHGRPVIVRWNVRD